jgi:very-short-patch-repair endonuclease
MSDWTPEYWSWLERKFGQLLGDMRVKGVKHNHQAEGLDGRIYYLDFAIPDIKLAIECDSALYHSKSFQKRRDKTRQTTLEEAGWHFVRFTGDDILHNPEDAKKKLQKAITEASSKKQARLLMLKTSVRLR